jgi:hypothetical protein
MASQLEKKNNLISALVAAIGSTSDLVEILEDLAEASNTGLAIRNHVQLSKALEPDCRNLIRHSKDHTNGLSSLHVVLKQHLHHKAAWPALEHALIAYRSSVEAPTSPLAETTSKGVYISYAWGDSSLEGQRRGRLVDQLYAAISAAEITVLIDREQIKPGDRISNFMKAIAKGDAIIIILSQKYLESENCLFELNGIWKQANQDPGRFLQRVIPLTLPDVKLKSTEDLFAKSQYWSRRWETLKEQISQNIDTTGVEVFAKCKSIQEFALQLGDILALLNDKCEPRDFDRQAQEGFLEVINQIRAAKKI